MPKERRAEDEYAEEVQRERERLGSKSPEFAEAHKLAQLRLGAARFRRDGWLGAIHRPQQVFAHEYYGLVKAFYEGTIGGRQYLDGRIRLLRGYAKRLFRLELITAVFDDQWIEDFAKRSLEHERRLLPVPRLRNGFSDADAATLCDPLREFSKEFFKKVHSEFGIKRLKNHPAIFGGVDSVRCEAEIADPEITRARISGRNV